MTREATIDFSAQFGGRDAAHSVLPVFHALKAAAHGVTFEGFPYPQLAFVLRVDGEVHEYGLSGPGNVEFDTAGRYVSVDIGITAEDRVRLRNDSGVGVVSSFLASAVRHLRELGEPRLADADFKALSEALVLLRQRYESAVG